MEKKVVPVIIVAVLTSLTIGTTAMSISKVAGGLQVQNSGTAISPTIVKDETEDEKSVASDITRIPKSSKALAQTGVNSAEAQQQANLLTNAVPTLGMNLAGNVSACVITIFGKQYDVSGLRKTHSGGDVFRCGTDQSTLYQSQHGTNVSRLAQYAVSSTTVSTNPSPTQGSVAVQLPSPTIGQTINTNACIITIFGRQYDVAPLRNTHSGGDVFQCGTDMSSIYQSQHGTNVSRIARYSVTTSGTTGSNGTTSPMPSATISITPSRDEHEEDD